MKRPADALRAICEPDAVDEAAKADQDRLIAKFGGLERACHTEPSDATPVPGA